MTAWTDLVGKTYKNGVAAGKPNYKFKDAMKDAAKIYKKTATKVVDAEVAVEEAVAPSKKSRKSKRSRKSKKSKKCKMVCTRGGKKGSRKRGRK